MSQHLHEALRHLTLHLLSCPAPEPASADPAGTPNMLNQILKELRQMSDTFDNEMSQLRADVTAQSTVIASATTAFQGLAAQLLAAENAAKAAGATDAQIASVATLRQGLEGNTATLAAAIPQNTPTSAPAATDPATPVPTADPAPSAVTPPTA